LRDNGIEPTIIEYLKDIPTGDILKDLAAKLGKHPNEFVRKGEADFKENNLQETLDNDSRFNYVVTQQLQCLPALASSGVMIDCKSVHLWSILSRLGVIWSGKLRL